MKYMLIMNSPRIRRAIGGRDRAVRVAQRRMVDHLRSEASRRNRDAAVAEGTRLAVAPETDGESAIDPDDTLVLLFMCCHPALTSASAIALTLRAVGGLTTAEIAKSFLVPEVTIGRRISRAKERIKASGIAFRLPDADERAERLGSVLHVLYLVFNEGYTTSSGAELRRADLSKRDSRCSRRCRTTSDCERAIGSMRCAPTCWNVPATSMQRWRCTGRQRRRRRARRRRTTS